MSGLIFSVNRNILFHGVYLFGSEGNDYSVTLTIRQLPNYATVVSTKGKFSSLHRKSENYWGFDVFLNPPVFIIKGNKYCMDAAISGPDSFGGRHGNSYVESSGVTFQFQDWTGITGVTGVTQGQLPEFIFSPQE